MAAYIIVGFVCGAVGFLACALMTVGAVADRRAEVQYEKFEKDPLDSIKNNR
ncbi:MAG: hypothetical protein JJE03_07750 [Peptostreptococcaceae bacterium]|nr:hypothetical protein [Peptostreptococcaceae bacterium]